MEIQLRLPIDHHQVDDSNEESSPTLAVHEMPGNRIEAVGPAALSDSELLAVALAGTARETRALQVAQRALAEAGSLVRLASWPTAYLQRFDGIGERNAKRLRAVLELGRRSVAQGRPAAPELRNSHQVAEYMRPAAAFLEIEKLWVLCLNQKARIVKAVEATSGTLTSALAHPREIFRIAIREAAASIILVHNHPSGDPTASAADLQITRLVRDASRTVEIELRDHVILGEPARDPVGRGWYSFRDAGIL